ERGKREICWVDANLMNIVIAVYGVLFLDWNSQGNPEHKPFEGIRSWFFGLTGDIWTKDQARKSDAEETTRTGTSTSTAR
ncbi:hypothetical protein IFR04_015121, partial [Cadophora malorum]